MNKGKSLACLASLLLVAGSGAGCRVLNKHASPGIMGGVEVKDEQVRSAMPTQGPRTIYVADFVLDTQNFEGDQGVRGMLPGQLQQQSPVQLGQRLPHPFATNDPAAAARGIVLGMNESLVKSLREKGLPAERLPDPAGGLPKDGWLLQGMFTEVAEGNRFKRAIIGFGQGASSMEVQVGVSDLASANPRAAFIVFGTVKDPGKLPGAIVTMNPYVAAAKFVLEKNATGKDIQKTADQIVDEVLKYQQQIKNEADARRMPPALR